MPTTCPPQPASTDGGERRGVGGHSSSLLPVRVHSLPLEPGQEALGQVDEGEGEDQGAQDKGHLTASEEGPQEAVDAAEKLGAISPGDLGTEADDRGPRPRDWGRGPVCRGPA